MSNGKQKNFERLKRKRIWPSIVIFTFFIIMCIGMIALFMQLFATYIVGTKVTQMYEEAQHAGEMLDGYMSRGQTVSEAVDSLSDFLKQDSAVYVADRDRRPVAGVGSSEPNLDAVLHLTAIHIPIGPDFTVEMGGEMGLVMVADSEQGFAVEEGLNSLFGVSLEEVLAGTFQGDNRELAYNHWLNETILNQRFWLQVPLRDMSYKLYVRCVMQIKRQDIFYVLVFGALALILLLVPTIFLFVNTIRAIVTQRKITKILYMDMVTGGRNWLYFQNTAERILTRRWNAKKAYAIINLHLERYQNYCACYGVKEGEELLESMDGFLSARTARGEVHARYEGADFGLLLCCEGQDAREYQSYCQKKVRSLLAELMGLRPGQKVHYHAGIYMLYPSASEDGKGHRKRKGIDINQLYNYANTARMSAKSQEEQRITFFDQRMLGRQIWDRKVEESMEAALRNEEFQVYLQPKYSPADERLVGAEALVRWDSPTEGVISPNRFIPIFEENGFITQLDDYMISHVAKLQAEWTIQGKKMVPVSVNISRAHFSQEGLAEHICQLVDAYGPKHELIELEVTESAFFDDKDTLIETVKQLKAYGFTVSMDDFGAGYSSLNSLKDIPLDVLKLDAEFFHGEDGSGRGEIVVREAVSLARNLNMRVVAEGIEKKEQVDFLISLGCDMIQGFYYAKPMPVAEFEEKVEKDA